MTYLDHLQQGYERRIAELEEQLEAVEKREEVERIQGLTADDARKYIDQRDALVEQLEAWENGLARAYHDHREYQTAIATLCDLYLDPRGGLLGRVRSGPVSFPAKEPRS